MDERNRWAGMLAEAATERATQPRRICDLCVELMGVSGAGISLVTPTGNHGVVCATDDVSARIEDLQLTLGEGPCVDAVTSGAPVMVPDLSDAELVVERWPAFLRGAEEAGVRAVFALPLRIGAIGVGALDLYRGKPGDLSFDHLPGLLMAADAAAYALLHLNSDRDDAFRDDSDARSSYQMQVHQATGMVQVQLGVGTDDAFLALRARAFATGRSLSEIATDVVARRLRFSPEDT